MSKHYDGRPLSALTIDPDTRPPKPQLGKVTDSQRQAGRHLAAIHRHYLKDLARIAQVMARIEGGETPPADLAHIVLHTEMAKNFAAAGTLCGQQCWALTMHHNIEEQSIFPQLQARGSVAVRTIVDRLRAEHEVVHALLERLGKAAESLTAAPSATDFAETRAIFDRLVSVVQSHFHFEETALAEALGVYQVDI
ncbi:hypothetical protein DSM110093_00571 [Sulfitobacter sp. DSM 110093]|uniref:hemerythrin domain-containing protein n=1 Tax=Sulfitobacter sp. DSM 110093 TaxID=2883127 RepID=UPI001FAD8338|nr:hemerythrin domain-containing protein [Sulfitobacter sp. DSM 110093]UOA30812.1 hypothetical protein DSM110093_00571 [Sulfitobacter sp. DSM 110093]